MPSRWPHEGQGGLTNSIRKRTFARPSGNFLTCQKKKKDFAPLTKLLPAPEKVDRRPYDGLRCPHEWPDVFTIRAECEKFYHRVSFLCQLWDSVTPALRAIKTYPTRLTVIEFILTMEPRYEKTGFLHMRKQRRRSAAQ